MSYIELGDSDCSIRIATLSDKPVEPQGKTKPVHKFFAGKSSDTGSTPVISIASNAIYRGGRDEPRLIASDATDVATRTTIYNNISVFYVYILFSKKDHGLYIGFTKDLKQRFKQHTAGQVRSTKYRNPLLLIHYESFLLKEDATAREEYLKSGYGREQLKSQLKQLFMKLKVRWLK